ncbi:MAG: hypothetical protein ACRDLN_12995 [Solirubrobacteraceae bacterium]
MVDVTEYERRLFRVFAIRKGVERFPGGVIDDAWLEGDHPKTEIAIVVTFNTKPGCRYGFRCAIWTAIAGASPEAHADEIDIRLQDWTGTLGSMPSEPCSTYEPRAARMGVSPRRPGPGSQV